MAEKRSAWPPNGIVVIVVLERAFEHSPPKKLRPLKFGCSSPNDKA
jgi:hypothetical protein